MASTVQIMNRHKALAFMALGGAAVAGLMHLGWVNDFLPVPQLAVAVGGYAMGRVLHHKDQENGVFRTKIIKNSFFALGALGAMAAVRAFDIDNSGAVQLGLSTITSYGLHGFTSSVINTYKKSAHKKQNKPSPQHNFKIPEKKQAQAAVDKIRQRPQEETEFQPLNLR